MIRPYVDKYLYSLINGLTSPNFGFNTVDKVFQNVKIFYENLHEGEKLYIDSGGYSIIVGDVSPRNTSMFIECYGHFLERYAPEYCHHMFSLDIPIFLKYPDFNTYSNLYDRNYKANHMMKSILDKDPALYEKLIFVYQFKIKEQYEIWNQIYDEFWAKENRLKHFAIGGLVGLRGITGIKFSPYIGMLYKLLKIVYDKNLEDESILHVLGVYGIHDRFSMAFMQRLFNDVYLKDSNPLVQISYDTINYFVSGLFKIRDLDSIIPLDNETYLNDDNRNLLDFMEKIIKYPDALNETKRNIQCLIENKDLHDTILYSFLNIIRQLIADDIMRKTMKEEDLLNRFLYFDNFNSLKNNLKPIFKNLEIKYPFVLKNYTDKILNNFQWISSFHQWWMSGADPIRLEKGMDLFIQKINFPKVIMDDRG
jgi:hypothetical protein